MKKAVLKHLEVFTGKLQTCNFIKYLQTQVFSSECCEISRTYILKNSC